jgi:hypothetical protein
VPCKLRAFARPRREGNGPDLTLFYIKDTTLGSAGKSWRREVGPGRWWSRRVSVFSAVRRLKISLDVLISMNPLLWCSGRGAEGVQNGRLVRVCGLRRHFPWVCLSGNCLKMCWYRPTSWATSNFHDAFRSSGQILCGTAQTRLRDLVSLIHMQTVVPDLQVLLRLFRVQRRFCLLILL